MSTSAGGRRLILIGGSSHAGKSTLAAGVAAALDWELISTDQLGRHPGRPWPEPRPHVARYYERLDDDSIWAFLQDHYGNMWLWYLRQLLDARLAPGAVPLVLEGSALRPEFIAPWLSTLDDPDRVDARWLHADADLLTARIRTSSRWQALTPARRQLVDRFLARTLKDNEVTAEAARRYGLAVVRADDNLSPGAFARQPREPTG